MLRRPRQRYGAIYVHNHDANTYGVSTDDPSQQAADARAAQACQARVRPGERCLEGITFHNACGALAAGPKGSWGADWGFSRSQAISKAASACRRLAKARCVQKFVICTG